MKTNVHDMRAWVINRFGSAQEVFEVVQLARPELVADQVLVRVQATSINPADYLIRSGVLAGFAPAFPAVLHGDVAGIVEAVGDGVTHIQPGDRVFGFAGGITGLPGAAADFAVLHQSLVVPVPDSVALPVAGVLPLVGITAFQGIVHRGQVRQGHDVLIYGGTGGVGHLALQLARRRGANVYVTVADDEQAALALKLGATDVIFFQQETVGEYRARFTGGRGFDVVFDTVGNRNLTNSFQAAALHGTIVTTGASLEMDLSPLLYNGLDLKVINMFLPLLTGVGREQYRQDLQDLISWVADGSVQVVLDPQQFQLDQLAQAHAHAESGTSIGKISVLHPSHGSN